MKPFSVSHERNESRVIALKRKQFGMHRRRRLVSNPQVTHEDEDDRPEEDATDFVHLLQQNEEVGARIVRDIIGSRSVAPGQWEELLRTLKEHRSIEYATRRASEFAERAKEPLYAFPPSSERDALLALPDYILSRDR